MATNFSLPIRNQDPVPRKPVGSESKGALDIGQHDLSMPSSEAMSSSRNPKQSGPRDSLKLQESPSSPVKIRIPSIEALLPSVASIEDRESLPNFDFQDTSFMHDTSPLQPVQQNKGVSTPSLAESPFHLPNRATNSMPPRSNTPTIHLSTLEDSQDGVIEQPQLQYFHFAPNKDLSSASKAKGSSSPRQHPTDSISPSIANHGARRSISPSHHKAGGEIENSSRPDTPQTLGSELHIRGRSVSPAESNADGSLSPPRPHRRDVSSASSTRRSFDPRPASYVDLLNIPYTQQMVQQNMSLDNAKLRAVVGTNASLLDTKKTLDMYRANVKKTNDLAIQYEFAIFMVNAAQEAAAVSLAEINQTNDGLASATSQTELLREARHILQRLADKSYIFAQYYLADGYASGLFNNGKADYERGFPLFLSAAKHGHAEAGYRTALCYEFGWGARKDYAKAVQFYRQSASKNHPGAAIRLGKACLGGDMGLINRYKEGVKWLKRAAESADLQHNSGPFELGLLHLTGYGDDVFKDEAYAAQLFTKSAELGHSEANLRMGEAYEHGLLTCPRDPALSIHFYTGAAQAGVPRAMMALCAWYMVGAQPLLEKDEGEAYEWAKRAAETGFHKAEYAMGYFTEMGIGCRRDPLEANVWYVRAADQDDERAKQRLAIIREAETGDIANSNATSSLEKKIKKKRSLAKGSRDEKDCLVM